MVTNCTKMKVKPFFLFVWSFTLFNSCISTQNSVLTNKSSRIQQDAHSIVKEKVSKIGNIYFDSGSFELTNRSKSKLNQLVKILDENPIFEVLVLAHTDTKGNESYNSELSKKRAEIVKLFLLKKGVLKNRIYLEAFGETKPINKCSKNVICAASLQQENRRVEFVVFSD